MHPDLATAPHRPDNDPLFFDSVIPDMDALQNPSPRLLLAPMEGLLDHRLRSVLTAASHYDWGVTEFVRITDSLLPRRCYARVAPELDQGSRTATGVPIRVQLLGSDPACLAENAARLATLKPAGIDLNFGCPAPIVNRHGGGAILLDTPTVLYRITAAVKRAIDGSTPLTAKMRLGVRDKSRALEAAQALCEGGAELLVVHARTKEEGYRPPAHWAWVAHVAEAIPIPVVANGEIWTVADYLQCRAESGRRDVMLGRGAVADPFLCERIRDLLAGRRVRSATEDWGRVWPLLERYWSLVRTDLVPRHTPGRLKQWLNLLRRHYPQAAALFHAIRTLTDPAEIDLLMTAPPAIHSSGRPRHALI